jgi:hypothetical protein
MNYQVPILFIFFNRTEVALRSFEKIRQLKPSLLFLACDGARKAIKNEKETIYKLRENILNKIDWDCNIKKLFQEENLGCSKGVYTAISWMFSNVDKGIILEDDCIPQNSFFQFMEELLNRYENDERIGMVAGYNDLGQIHIDESYCFSRYKACWGWATWKRSWKNMDIELDWRKTKYFNSVITNMGYKSADISDWQYKLRAIDSGAVSAWDWQWYFSLGCQNQLSIFPKISLVSNIGFGECSTHTFKEPEFATAKEEMIFPLKHPQYILPYYNFDQEFYKANNSFFKKIRNYIPIPIFQKIKKILKY